MHAFPNRDDATDSIRHARIRHHLPNVPILTLKIKLPPFARTIALPIRPRPRPTAERHALILDTLENRIKLLVRR